MKYQFIYEEKTGRIVAMIGIDKFDNRYIDGTYNFTREIEIVDEDVREFRDAALNRGEKTVQDGKLVDVPDTEKAAEYLKVKEEIEKEPAAPVFRCKCGLETPVKTILENT